MSKHLLTVLAIVTLLAGAPLLAGDGDGTARPAPKRHRGKAPLKIGAMIPEAAAKVMLKSVDGKEYSVAGVAGEKGTLVIFSCNHCPWVVKWEARLTSICNEYRKKGFGVIVINSNDDGKRRGDDMESMTKRAKARGFEFPYVRDPGSKIARLFRAKKTPEVFLFNAKKKLTYTGAIDDNAGSAADVGTPYLINALKATSAGTPVIIKRTKALGCSIKFARKSKSEASGT